jgi:hypothetical protein
MDRYALQWSAMSGVSYIDLESSKKFSRQVREEGIREEGLRKGSIREQNVRKYEFVNDGERGAGVREQSGREASRRGEDHVKPAGPRDAGEREHMHVLWSLRPAVVMWEYTSMLFSRE